MAAKIFLLLIVASFLLIVLIESYDLGSLCNADSDCPDATGTYCYRITTVSPPCQKGTCLCRPGFIFDSGTCKQLQNLTNLGNPCNGAINERLPWGAICNASVIACRLPFYLPATPTRCVQTVNQPIFDEVCAPTTELTSCNTTLNLFCSTTTAKCECSLATMIHISSTSTCRQRIYGDACTTAAQCDSAQYSNLIAAGGGVDCVSSTCGCLSGFSLVKRTSYDVNTKEKTELNLCLKGATSNLTQNATCHVAPETTSVNGALVCSTSFACIRCPEDTNTNLAQGTCRTVLTSSCQAILSSEIGKLTPEQVSANIKACGTSFSGQTTNRSSLMTLLATLFASLWMVSR